MSIYKRGKKGIYWYRFMWRGEEIRETTRQTNDKVARNQESAHRTRLANGEVGIREKKPAPTLKEFLKNDFLSFAATRHAAKRLTYRYYKQGCDMLQVYVGRPATRRNHRSARAAAKYSALSPSGINRALRTLRRALNLAYQWGDVFGSIPSCWENPTIP
jgi:hypothetical protein